MRTKLSIVSIASEVIPFSKSGGLAIVAHSLPLALSAMGHDVLVITPYYKEFLHGQEQKMEQILSSVPVFTNGDEAVQVNYWRSALSADVPVYLVECDKYFGRMKTLYGSSHENSRFYLFNLAAIELIRLLNQHPNIFHCHDWHTGLMPYILKNELKHKEYFANTATVFTIHNLSFQLGHNWWEIPQEYKDNGETKLPPLHSEAMEFINFAKRGILSADMISTVSEQYAAELLEKESGQDLHRILQNRRDRFFGIINGIDYEEYNPQTDPGLPLNYDVGSLEKRNICKQTLQQNFGLAQRADVPILVMTSRIAEQKGMDLVIHLLDILMRLDIQMIVMGDEGDREYMKILRKLARKHSQKFILQTPFLHDKETSFYAGADMTLLPSRFEPCGINQLISMRYGCVPIVHKIGGLSDTVTNFQPNRNKGTGFVFRYYDIFDLLMAITRALEIFKEPKRWRMIVEQGMKQSFSWEIPANKYVSLFRKALKHQTLRH